MNNRITIKDIAKEFGCSVNCVSRALMDAPDISEPTKAKIRKLADEMGYVYNRNAATLRAGKSRTIGILFDNMLNPFFYIMTNYIWDRLDREGYSIVTFKNSSALFSETVVRQILSDNVDGLLSFLIPTPDAQKAMEDNSFPMVVIGRKTNGLCDCVYINDEEGGRVAARAFIQHGYKKPMYLGEISDLECSVDRGRGFKDEFDKIGVKTSINYIDLAVVNKYAAFFENVVRSGDMPDCVFCFSDLAAYEVMSVLDRYKLDIPVIGYDNIQKEILLPGTLKSVSYDKKEMSERAVSMLLNKINGSPESLPHEACIGVGLE